MKAALLLLLTNCYSPQFAACEVSCGSDSLCPEDLTCGDDHFCRAVGQTTACDQTLTVTTNQQGDGHVASTPGGIDCSTHDTQPCISSFAPGTSIQLVAMRFNSTQFIHWSGGPCDGSNNPTCSFTLSDATSITAVFH
jgi:hypothetical protein